MSGGRNEQHASTAGSTTGTVERNRSRKDKFYPEKEGPPERRDY